MAGLAAPVTHPLPGDSLAAFQDVILAVGSTLDPATVLQRVVEAIAEATGGSDSYISLYDEEADELVLAAATESAAADFLGTLRLPLGQGVTGWVGASRQTYVVERDLHADPRFALHPGLGEERYDALICVPIVSRTDRLIGVVSVWSTKGDRFTADHVRLAEWIAVVVAGAIENAQLHASVSRRTRVLERMAELSTMATSGLATARLLELTTELAREVGAADLAVLLVRDPSGADRLILKTVGSGSAQIGDALTAARQELLAIDAEVRRRAVTWDDAAGDVRDRVGRWFGASAAVPLRIAGEELGLLCCFRGAGPTFSSEDQTLLATIAGHASLALKIALLAEDLVQHNELGHFVRDVDSGRISARALRQRAATLGLRARSYTVVIGAVALEPHAAPEWDGSVLVLRQIAGAILDRSPGTHCTANGDEVIALVPSAPGEGIPPTLRAMLDELRSGVRARFGGAVTFGISAPADSLEDMRTAIAEAREIVAVATGNAGGGVYALEDVGHQLLLSRAAELSTTRDRYALSIEAIARYDRVRNGSLLQTLSVFLDLRSRNDAARALFVHRNTLAQRLARIERLTGLELSNRDEWFPLQLALRIHLLRCARASR